MNGTRSRRSWHRLVIVLFLTLGVVVMHGAIEGFDDTEAHAIMVGSDPSQLSTMALTAAPMPVPGPDQPSHRHDPCHAVGEICCLSALPCFMPRQLLALIVMALALIGMAPTPLEPGFVFAHLNRPALRHPPNLFAICVLRT
jgi:hypothetical protein